MPSSKGLIGIFRLTFVSSARPLLTQWFQGPRQTRRDEPAAFGSFFRDSRFEYAPKGRNNRQTWGRKFCARISFRISQLAVRRDHEQAGPRLTADPVRPLGWGGGRTHPPPMPPAQTGRGQDHSILLNHRFTPRGCWSSMRGKSLSYRFGGPLCVARAFCLQVLFS